MGIVGGDVQSRDCVMCVCVCVCENKGAKHFDSCIIRIALCNLSSDVAARIGYLSSTGQ